MNKLNTSINKLLINEFEKEFNFIKDNFTLVELLPSNTIMDNRVLTESDFPASVTKFIEKPSVYVFCSKNSIFFIGVSIHNTKKRIMQHLIMSTNSFGYRIWDINNLSDNSIQIFTIKNESDKHWLLTVESFFEEKFKHLKRPFEIA